MSAAAIVMVNPGTVAGIGGPPPCAVGALSTLEFAIARTPL